ncbi:MAG: MFS transporter [Gammaproteobacteria bacterium]|nr:MFS transporter [Gammaproteobacteria bacterium]NIM73072.1 MFS transporter [Gammaproteobacteria bacterium]NIN38689.1 MFS transporter [Gammaproteobacteria bacterium]NIO24825.1 MFS transporter [Gammaproteobacteria bacterium]NIO65428.1 MFS transporter [Gammaproteobacteria bacterium]
MSADTGNAGNAFRRIMLLMGLYLACVQINRSGGAVIASDLIDTRAYPAADVGTVMGSMFLASAVIQLPAGVLYDRLGPRAMLSAMNVIAVAGLLMFAFAGSVEGLSIGRTLIGIGHGTVIAGIYLLAVAWVSPERVATVAAAVIGVAGGAGALLATTPLALALESIGFTATFAALALLTLGFSGAILIVVRDAPGVCATHRARRSEGLWQSLRGLKEVVAQRNLWPVYVMGSCFTAPFLTVGGLWAGPYLREVHGLSNAQSSYVLLAMMVALYLGYVAYGPMDRVFNSRKRVVLAGVVGMLVCLTALAALPDPPLSAVVGLLVAFALFSPFFVTLAAHCRGFVPADRVGRAIACINLTGLVSVFIMQVAAGAIVESAAGQGSAGGYRLVFAMVAAVLLVTGAIYTRARDVPVRGAGSA